ncbi:MAG: glycosyltransferase family 2 protein [Berryella intestinalis]|nr:glycosyltransferase family 2 protein [Berryella intestinalis]
MADLRKRVLALVPAYNEEGSIVSAIEDLKAHASDIDYLVVNDGSRDATASICRERGYRMLSLPINLGLTGAFQAGMKYAHEQAYDYVIQFDADGQHSAAYVSDLVACAEITGADIVVGSRFVN